MAPVMRAFDGNTHALCVSILRQVVIGYNPVMINDDVIEQLLQLVLNYCYYAK